MFFACWVKHSADDILKYFSTCFEKKEIICIFMQIFSNGDSLHKMSIPIFLEIRKNSIISLLFVDFTQSARSC